VIPTRARKIADWVVGVTLIAVGVVGLFLPVVQGLVFILAGLAVLSSHSRIARDLLDRLKRAGRGVRDRIAGRSSDR
jgi:uncharacterized protein